MSPTRVHRAAVAAILVAIGCADESSTDVPSVDIDVPTDLSFVLPEIPRETFAQAVVEELGPGSGPARAFSDDPDPADEPDMSEVARIFGATTSVGFTQDYGYATGRHSYTGNVGRVDTEVVVTSSGQVLGRQPASRQNHNPYLLDWGEVKSIWAEAYFFTDIECGLQAGGDSDHSAWWQWFMAGPTPTWGQAELSSQAFPPADQPDCSDVVEGGGTGGKDAGTDGGSSSQVCWYLVTWDPYTGEVLDSEFLYCDNVVGG